MKSLYKKLPKPNEKEHLSNWIWGGLKVARKPHLKLFLFDFRVFEKFLGPSIQKQ